MSQFQGTMALSERVRLTYPLSQKVHYFVMWLWETAAHRLPWKSAIQLTDNTTVVMNSS